MSVELAVIAAAVALAAGYFLYRFIRLFTGKSSGCSCCGCKGRGCQRGAD
jgi:hypothetical protein